MTIEEGLHLSGVLATPTPTMDRPPPRASDDLVEKYLGPKNPEFQGSDRHPIASHRAALSPALLRSLYPPLRLPRDHGLRGLLATESRGDRTIVSGLGRLEPLAFDQKLDDRRRHLG